MLPSQTVENYLKSIYLAEAALPGDRALVPMGQLASALGVTPGTATTMVKALADSGLAHYEPYSGVRLTPAGEKLASMAAMPTGRNVNKMKGPSCHRSSFSRDACDLRR